MIQTHEVRQYRIGEYAKHLGVTPDFLKHYEQFHLVSSVTRESGYRYYPFDQSFKILECMRLRNYGIILKDMNTMLNDDDFPTIQDKLNHQVEELERKIRFEQAVVEEHRWFARWMERMQDKTEDWYIVDSKEMLFLPHSNQYDFLKDERIYELLNDWVSWMPIVKSCMEIRSWSKDGNSLEPAHWSYSWGLLLSAEFASKYHIPVNDIVKRLSSRKVFLYSFIVKGIQPENEIYANAIHPALLKIKELGLNPTGNLYKIALMYSHVSSVPEQYGMIAIPID